MAPDLKAILIHLMLAQRLHIVEYGSDYFGEGENEITRLIGMTIETLLSIFPFLKY